MALKFRLLNFLLQLTDKGDEMDKVKVLPLENDANYAVIWLKKICKQTGHWMFTHRLEEEMNTLSNVLFFFLVVYTDLSNDNDKMLII